MFENRVGSLSGIVGLLHDRMVEVLGLSLADSSDVAVARLVVSDPDLAMQVFLEKGIPHVMGGVVVVELTRGASDLGRCLKTLNQAETNIHFSYPLLVRSEARNPLLVLHLEDSDFAEKLLEQQGFPLVCQEDLSR